MDKFYFNKMCIGTWNSYWNCVSTLVLLRVKMLCKVDLQNKKPFETLSCESTNNTTYGTSFSTLLKMLFMSSMHMQTVGLYPNFWTWHGAVKSEIDILIHSLDSSICSILTWYQGGRGFKSWQGRGYF